MAETDYDKKVKQIRELFDAVPEVYEPNNDETRFIDERNRLEKEVAWSLNAYAANYKQIKNYGLDEKLMIQFEWLIIFYLENRGEEFLGSAFYQMFKNHEVVRRAEMEYERRNELT
jgi:hypothetical protein